MISGELNQSSNSPRSSIIWNAPTARLSAPKPIQSMRTPSRRAVSFSSVMMPMAAMMPNGTLI